MKIFKFTAVKFLVEKKKLFRQRFKIHETSLLYFLIKIPKSIYGHFPITSTIHEKRKTFHFSPSAHYSPMIQKATLESTFHHHNHFFSSPIRLNLLLTQKGRLSAKKREKKMKFKLKAREMIYLRRGKIHP